MRSLNDDGGGTDSGVVVSRSTNNSPEQATEAQLKQNLTAQASTQLIAILVSRRLPDFGRAPVQPMGLLSFIGHWKYEPTQAVQSSGQELSDSGPLPRGISGYCAYSLIHPLASAGRCGALFVIEPQLASSWCGIS